MKQRDQPFDIHFFSIIQNRNKKRFIILFGFSAEFLPLSVEKIDTWHNNSIRIMNIGTLQYINNIRLLHTLFVNLFVNFDINILTSS